MFDFGEVRVFWHVYRWMSPIPGVISAIIAIEHVISGILEVFCCFFAFFHIAARFHKLFARQGAAPKSFGFAYHAIAKAHWKIFSARFFDSFDDFHRKTVTIFKRTTIFIGPMVDVLQRELIEKIAFVDGVNLDAIDARFFEKLRCFRESVYKFMNPFFGHLLARNFVAPTIGGGTCRSANHVEVHNRLR